MNTLPFLPARTLTVLCSRAAASDPVVDLLATLAIHGPVTVLDGGNCFPAYHLARTVSSRTSDLSEVMQHIFVRRAFTCHQMLSLLDGTPSLPQPYLILDLLATFYDEQIDEREVRRLLEACLQEVERLAQIAPVLVTVTPARTPERGFLVEQVCARANQLFMPVMPEKQAVQPALFPLPAEHRALTANR
jgi:hypothetical protein